MRRTSMSSRTVLSWWSSTTNASASVSTVGCSDVTNVPSPRRESRTRNITRALTASRSELRDTASCSLRPFSGGSRSPGASSPEMIMRLIRRIASSVTDTP